MDIDHGNGTEITDNCYIQKNPLDYECYLTTVSVPVNVFKVIASTNEILKIPFFYIKNKNKMNTIIGCVCVLFIYLCISCIGHHRTDLCYSVKQNTKYL